MKGKPEEYETLPFHTRPVTVHAKLAAVPSYGPALCDTEISMRGASQVCVRYHNAASFAHVLARVEESEDSLFCPECLAEVRELEVRELEAKEAAL